VRWRPFDTIIFDCDSTLSSIEGIDELANILDKKTEVKALTNSAMNGDTDLSEVYGQRLELLKPTKQEVLALRQAYKAGTVTYAKELVDALNDLDTDTWIVSGGLHDAVEEYGIWLGIDSKKIHAVGSSYDPLRKKWWIPELKHDAYLDYESGELTETAGKGQLINQHIPNRSRKVMFGDGVSDLAAEDDVDLFVAYAGVIDRPAVTEKARVVIQSESLAPALCLIVGAERVIEMLNSKHKSLAEASLECIQSGAIRFNDNLLGEKFMSSFDHAMKGI